MKQQTIDSKITEKEMKYPANCTVPRDIRKNVVSVCIGRIILENLWKF